MAEQFYIPPRENDIDSVYHWERRGDFLLVARYMKRWQCLEDDERLINPRDIDLGYWRGYVGNTHLPSLHEHLDLHRGGRYWMNSSVIPRVEPGILMVGFSGQSHNDLNIRPDGSQGYFMQTDLSPIIRLDCDEVFAIVNRAIDKYLANPTLKLIKEPEAAKILAYLQGWVEKVGLPNLQRMPNISVKLAA